MKTYRITLPYACYSIDVNLGTVIDAAPIARWAISRNLTWFKTWVKRKGGSVRILKQR